MDDGGCSMNGEVFQESLRYSICQPKHCDLIPAAIPNHACAIVTTKEVTDSIGKQGNWKHKTNKGELV
jgi:hypothetical protein